MAAASLLVVRYVAQCPRVFVALELAARVLHASAVHGLMDATAEQNSGRHPAGRRSDSNAIMSGGEWWCVVVSGDDWR